MLENCLEKLQNSPREIFPALQGACNAGCSDGIGKLAIFYKNRLIFNPSYLHFYTTFFINVLAFAFLTIQGVSGSDFRFRKGHSALVRLWHRRRFRRGFCGSRDGLPINSGGGSCR